MPRALFLDLYGVLADSRAMSRQWRERMADILRRDFGGDRERWLDIHDVGLKWYMDRGARLDALPPEEREGPRWVEAVDAMEAAYIDYIFGLAGLPPPADRRAYSRALEEEVVRGIDALYPDVRPSLEALSRRGHRLFLSTNARRTNGESALVGGGVRDLFDGLVVLETGEAKKDRPHYWRRAFALTGVTPPESVCVDDVPRFLGPAAELGAVCLQIRRPERKVDAGPYPVLPSLAALPAFLDGHGRTRSSR